MTLFQRYHETRVPAVCGSDGETPSITLELDCVLGRSVRARPYEVTELLVPVAAISQSNIEGKNTWK